MSPAMVILFQNKEIMNKRGAANWLLTKYFIVLYNRFWI